MTKSNVNTVARTRLKLVAVNPVIQGVPELIEASLTPQEMQLISSFRAVRPDYAICLLASVAMLAKEYPADPAQKMQLVRPN